ncbi:hypothetical protein [Agromyces humi]|uniref:hypothetical protein n=1 Tax=Agromyces humi TaxID=1766800 RepID=UPI0013969AC3|nr:hypothetical protein [Agromyces humi]
MIDLVPAESIDPITACSAPTVRPEVRSTAAHIPAIMTIVRVEATGAAIAARIASLMTGIARIRRRRGGVACGRAS